MAVPTRLDGGLLLLLLAAVCCIAASAAPNHGQGHPSLASVSPAIVWGTKGLLGRSERVFYETLPLSHMWNGVLKRMLSKEPESQILVVFVGNQLRTWELGQMGSSPMLQPLRSAVNKAPSSMAFVNLVNQGQYGSDLASVISRSVDAAGAETKVVGQCAAVDDDQDLESDMEKILQDIPSEQRTVIVVCSSGGLADEMSQLQGVQKAMASYQGERAIIYLSTSRDEVPSIRPGRNLLQTKDIDAYVCDDLCYTQVKFIEAAILLLILALALAVGLCCLSILNAPTQYEKRRDD